MHLLARFVAAGVLALFTFVPACFAGGMTPEIMRIVDFDPAKAVDDARHALTRLPASDKAARLKNLRILINGEDALDHLEAHAEDVEAGIALARELGDMDSLVWLFNFKADIAWSTGHRENGMAILDDAIALAQRENEENALAWAYWKKGLLFFTAHRISDALAWVTKAYDLFDKQHDAFGMASSLAGIGVAWISDELNRDIPKAISYQVRALDLVDKSIYRRLASNVYSNIGNEFLLAKDYPQARKYLQTALRMNQEMRRPYDAALARIRLSVTEMREGHYGKALEWVDDGALADLASDPYRGFLVKALLIRAEANAQLGRRDLALAALSRAKQTLKPGDGRTESEYYSAAAKVQSALGDYRQAYDVVEQLRQSELRDAKAANAKAIQENKVRFEVELKEKENALLKAERKQAETRKVVLMLALVACLLMAGGVAFWLRKHAADARTEAAHQKALAEAEAAANLAKSAFLANMSHELRSPLNAILGFARLVARAPELMPATRGDAGVIVKSGEHLYALINQVLDLSKIEAGHGVLHETDFDLRDLCSELEELLGLAARQKGLELHVICAPDLPRMLRADAGKLRQVLTNLLGNAIKFTDKGNVRLRVERKASEAGDARLLCSVADSGRGIAPDELERLGAAFVQGAAGRSSREGTGLGLAISRGFVRLMGGELTLASAQGEGTMVAFDIPLCAAAAASAPISQREERPIGLRLGQPRLRILAVDDLPEGRQLLVRLLMPLGFEVREAADGKEAVAVCEEWQPHLVWMDMRMPVMDGREATQRIRELEGGKNVKIIALTASSLEEDREQIMAYGCDDFLRKPFDENALFELMRKHLEIEFVYDGSALAREAPARAIGIVRLPVELRMRLKEAAVSLDSVGAAAAIESIRRHDAGLADMLTTLANDFNYAEMLALAETSSVDAAGA
jgi:signal transduction histidine kinase/CheY-like chemotaxis protein